MHMHVYIICTSVQLGCNSIDYETVCVWLLLESLLSSLHPLKAWRHRHQGNIYTRAARI